MTTVRVNYAGNGRWAIASTGEIVAIGIYIPGDRNAESLGNSLSRALNANIIRHAGNLLIEAWDPCGTNIIGQPCAEELLVAIQIKDGEVTVLVPR
jgi:hypothetical protein